MSLSKDAGHLFRFVYLFVIAFAVFLVVRHFVVPKTFGEYGHYRGAAIAEIAARPMHFAGHAEMRDMSQRHRRGEEGRQT